MHGLRSVFSPLLSWRVDVLYNQTFVEQTRRRLLSGYGRGCDPAVGFLPSSGQTGDDLGCFSWQDWASGGKMIGECAATDKPYIPA